MMDVGIRQEIQEAVAAGESALYSLYEARDHLAGARNWGIIDLFGGGFLTDLMKHSRMSKAQNAIEEAKRRLARFQKELRDVTVIDRLYLDVSDFLCFADFFFDGVIADYLVQSKIAGAREDVEYAIRQVEEIVAKLRAKLTQIV